MTFDVHFCGEEVKYVSFSGINEKACCAGDDKMDGGCCHNQKLSFKINDHATIDSISIVIDFKPEIIDFKPIQFVYSDQYYNFYQEEETIIDDPPPKVKTPIFIRNRVLRI